MKQSVPPRRRTYEPVPRGGVFPVSYDVRPYVLPKDEVGELHLHDCLEIGFCRSGRGVFFVDDKVLPFKGGDVSVVNDREFHRAQSIGDECALWHFIQFDPVFLLDGNPETAEFFAGENLGGADYCNVRDGAAEAELSGQCRLLVAELTAQAPGWRIAAAALLRHILVLLTRSAAAARRRKPLLQPVARGELQRLAPALQIISRDYAEPLLVSDLAAACCLSVPHFRRLFRAAFHKAPQQYLTRFRMQMGAYLLRERGYGVMETALAVGYASASSFHRHFKQFYGAAPRASGQ